MTGLGDSSQTLKTMSNAKNRNCLRRLEAEIEKLAHPSVQPRSGESSLLAVIETNQSRFYSRIPIKSRRLMLTYSYYLVRLSRQPCFLYVFRSVAGHSRGHLLYQNLLAFTYLLRLSRLSRQPRSMYSYHLVRTVKTACKTIYPLSFV